MDLLQKGWECPKCGAVMSPTTSACINCHGFTGSSISTNFIPATDGKNYIPYLDKSKGFDFQKEKGVNLQRITCLNCKHLTFSDMYGECNKQLRIVNPNDTCEYAEPKEGGEE